MERNLALDRFRGVAIILMLIVDDLDNVLDVPRFVRHAADTGFGLADIVAPLFIFAIGATFVPSFLRRAEHNKAQAYSHFVSRYMAIIGIGAIFSAVSTIAYEYSTWGALQAIGVAGLLTLCVVKLPAWARAAVALAVLGVYQVLNQGPIREEVFTTDHGGFLGAVAWGVMLILSTVMMELYNRGMKYFLPAAGALSVLAIVSALIVPVSKNRVSASYVLVCVAICCVSYLLVDILTKKLPIKKGLISWWGENPMLLYLLLNVVGGITQVPFVVMDIENRPLWIGLLDVLLVFTILSLIAWTLHRKNLKIKL